PAQELKAPAAAASTGASKSKFATPREQYDHAFRLLNQTQYDAAGKAFEDFIAAYPGDPLIGNAYYWAGETFYVRQNFTQAADYFRQGYEALPAGPKAGDNLLKLGMALNNLQKSTEACVVLKQVIAKFGSTSGSIKNKAEQERARAGCK
ncbi:MAG: tol-pal system protein YbgF, partial [Alphaproteobacteria bacterium]|nr:tol-pal system protein YbgF [Alphaproteobacteria bacterium]